ncbi:type I-E CRISPR-associated protein Cse1/CasA [Allosalinactinospora lopnorensis]|uniref:type I-E CRISPR-associated protein Cse1/CasA n=1 Tax=Allosalinactinospora lopnorensis TaxID=1352348 RepID=UPI000698A414|nr:type I-E CRISPR-associated protein Cse1/CasA [Allosalinactinospora lopnorensis]
MDCFDLAKRPWIRARTLDGDVAQTGLADLLSTAHRLSGIEAPLPPGYAGLWHILTALAYRITGLDRQEGVAEWRRRRDLWLTHGTFASCPPGLSGEPPPSEGATPVERYFARVPEGRFCLFGQRPFLQDPRLVEEAETSGINKFVLGRPTGDNAATWWTRHHASNQGAIAFEEAAWWLIVQWYYGAAGQITARTVGGTRSSSSKAGMLRNTITYFPSGASLFTSLLLSLVPPNPAIPDPASRPGPDLCPWEQEELPDPDAPPSPPGGMCALLTAVHTHALLLVPGEGGHVVDAYRTWAYRKPWPGLKRENPFLSYERSKGTQRRANPSRALWRDLDALLPETADGASGRHVAASAYRPPRFVEERLHLGGEQPGPAGITAVGFSQDPMTTDHTWWLSAVPPVLIERLREEENAAAARRLLALLAKECELLKARLRSAWRNGVRSGPREKLNQAWPSRGAARFWERAEKVFGDRLAADLGAAEPNDPTQEHHGRVAARGLTLTVYDEVTGNAHEGNGSPHPPSRQDFMLHRSIIKHRPWPVSARSPEGSDDL